MRNITTTEAIALMVEIAKRAGRHVVFISPEKECIPTEALMTLAPIAVIVLGDAGGAKMNHVLQLQGRGWQELDNLDIYTDLPDAEYPVLHHGTTCYYVEKVALQRTRITTVQAARFTVDVILEAPPAQFAALYERGVAAVQHIPLTAVDKLIESMMKLSIATPTTAATHVAKIPPATATPPTTAVAAATECGVPFVVPDLLCHGPMAERLLAKLIQEYIKRGTPRHQDDYFLLMYTTDKTRTINILGLEPEVVAEAQKKASSKPIEAREVWEAGYLLQVITGQRRRKVYYRFGKWEERRKNGSEKGVNPVYF